jgi:MoaA/NifB/PqqE/SkfB family radical SAM enzyme
LVKSPLLVLIYTVDCPLRCDFCWCPGERYEPPKIRKEDAIQYIKEAADLGVVKKVVFTGGEPFLFYEELVEVLGACEGLMPVRIVTSCYWAETKELAREKLKPLVEKGLVEISCSTDPSHQVFVPAAFVENAIEAGLALGITCEVVSVFWDTTSKIEETVRVFQHPRLRFFRHLAVLMGRGRQREVTWRDYDLQRPSQMGGCNPGGCDLNIYPDGEVYPCCAGELNLLGRLSFGNVKKDSLETILGRMQADAYVQLVFNRGFDAIYGLARWKFPHLVPLLPDDNDLASICQLCVRIHGDSALMEALKPLLDYGKKLVEAEQRLEGRKKEDNNGRRLEAKT